MIRNIIFDWSGTLVDDLPAVWRATNFVFTQAGLVELTLDQFRAEFCLPFQRFYERYTPHIAMAQLEQWFHGRFREVQDSVVELPHARGFLEFGQARGMRMFLLSTVHRDHFDVQTARNQCSGSVLTIDTGLISIGFNGKKETLISRRAEVGNGRFCVKGED